MKSIIHIGPPKTGTTSIQQMLSHHDQDLRGAGVLYFNNYRVGPSHNALAMALRRGEAGTAADTLLGEIAKGSYDTAILSSELFFSPWVSNKLSAALPRLLRRGATLVAYLRRHDLYFEAVYKQRLKTGQASTDPMEFLAGQKPGVYQFAASLTRGQRFFPDSTVIAREYSRSSLKDGNVVADFVDATGLDQKLPNLTVDFESNPSISYAVCCALSELAFTNKAERRKVLRTMSAENHPNLSRSRDVLSMEQREELLSGWDEDNKELARLYTPDRERFFEFNLSTGKDGYDDDATRSEMLDWARDYVRATADRCGVSVES